MERKSDHFLLAVVRFRVLAEGKDVDLRKAGPGLIDGPTPIRSRSDRRSMDPSHPSMNHGSEIASNGHKYT